MEYIISRLDHFTLFAVLEKWELIIDAPNNLYQIPVPSFEKLKYIFSQNGKNLKPHISKSNFGSLPCYSIQCLLQIIFYVCLQMTLGDL